jgi:hypothetical protein
MLHGFDSSEGLPESGTACYIEDLFAASGQNSRSSRPPDQVSSKGGLREHCSTGSFRATMSCRLTLTAISTYGR